ncbi:MAG: NfeD family protein [Clostridia bacterium]
MGFFTQFGLLFSNMQWFVIVCLIVGLVGLFIEIFQPGFGIFGIGGVILLIISVILRAIFHSPEDDVVTQSFQLLLCITVIMIFAFALFIIGNHKNWWKHSSIYQRNTAVDTEFSEGTKDFSNIIGKKGLAATDLHPAGKMKIENTVYDVVTENFFVEKNSEVEVVGVEGVKIIVKKI